MYVASCAPAAQTLSTDLEIVEAGTGLIKIYRINLWQTTELGDAMEEVIDLQFIIGFTTSGSGGQTTVIAAINSFDTAASTATVEMFNTTLAVTGTTRTTWRDGWNVRIPYSLIFLPEERPILRNGERGVLRLAAPADSTTMAASIVFEQL
jgi:hypothetical protein